MHGCLRNGTGFQPFVFSHIGDLGHCPRLLWFAPLVLGFRHLVKVRDAR